MRDLRLLLAKTNLLEVDSELRLRCRGLPAVALVKGLGSVGLLVFLGLLQLGDLDLEAKDFLLQGRLGVAFEHFLHDMLHEFSLIFLKNEFRLGKLVPGKFQSLVRLLLLFVLRT